MLSCTHWLRPRNPPPPHTHTLGLIYEDAIGDPLVGPPPFLDSELGTVFVHVFICNDQPHFSLSRWVNSQ
jgi:hypothetical protein